jgi:hypothetical protein
MLFRLCLCSKCLQFPMHVSMLQKTCIAPCAALHTHNLSLCTLFVCTHAGDEAVRSGHRGMHPQASKMHSITYYLLCCICCAHR